MSRTSKHQAALKRLSAAARYLRTEDIEVYVQFIEDRVRTRRQARDEWARLTPDQQSALRAYWSTTEVEGGAR